MRIYLAATLRRLADHVATGTIPGDTVRFTAPDEAEESEYAALLRAADASAALLPSGGRRVVLVAEVSDPDAPVPMRLIEAVHADTEDLPAAVLTDEDAPDLAWYAPQEIPDLLP